MHVIDISCCHNHANFTLKTNNCATPPSIQRAKPFDWALVRAISKSMPKPQYIFGRFEDYSCSVVDLGSGRFSKPQRLVLNQTRKRPIISEKLLSGTGVGEEMLLYNHIYMYAGLAHFREGVRKMIFFFGGGGMKICVPTNQN